MAIACAANSGGGGKRRSSSSRDVIVRAVAAHRSTPCAAPCTGTVASYPLRRVAGARRARPAATGRFPAMELVEGERILWQGRPSWRSQISFFVVWIPLALLPVIIAGHRARRTTGTPGCPTGSGSLISLLLVVLRGRLRRASGATRPTTWSPNQRLRVRRGILARTRADRPLRAGPERQHLAEPDGPAAEGRAPSSFDTAGTDQSDARLPLRGHRRPPAPGADRGRELARPRARRPPGL